MSGALSIFTPELRWKLGGVEYVSGRELTSIKRDALHYEGTLQISHEQSQLGNSISAWLRRPVRRTGTVEIPEIPAAVGTTIGLVRPENQDRAIVARYRHPRFFDRTFLACVLCDGMGGMVDGDRCAELAIGSFLRQLVTSFSISPQSIQAAVMDANDSVFRVYKGRGGTTLTAVVFAQHGSAWAATVGDSRLYELSDPRRIRQLSVDDTIAGELKRIKGTELTSQLESFSSRLAQFVGIGEGLEPRIQSLEANGAKVRYLLTSDGVQQIEDAVREKLIWESPSPVVLVHRLLQVSNWCGGNDNTSLVCVEADAGASLSLSPRVPETSLEIWDCFAKLEVLNPPEHRQATPVVSYQMPIARVGYSTIRPVRDYSVVQPKNKKTSKSRRKKGGGSDRIAPNPSGGNFGPAQQKHLEIEIVDTPQDEADKAKTGLKDRPPESKHSANDNSPIPGKSNDSSE